MKTSSQLATLLCLSVSFAGLSADTTDKPAAKVKPYTLEKCVVSDEKLGEMGDPVVFTYKGREVKLCCKNCRKDFDKDPAKVVAKIDKAEKEAAEKAKKK